MNKREIYWADLSPTIGSEISKTRPVVIVSNDINNKYAATVTILPIGSTVGKIYPFEVYLKKGEGSISNDSKIKVNQIRTIDKTRIKSLSGRLTKQKMMEVESAIKVHLDIK
jgi:mRNA interferase MazF